MARVKVLYQPDPPPDNGGSHGITPASPRPPVPIPTGHVLVVEDEPQMRRFLQAGLSNASIRVTLVTTGEAAILRLAKEPFDLIVLDLRLPGMSGLETCRQIKADPRLRHIPVIISTVYDEHQMRASAYAMGAAEYLVKPFPMNHLLARVARLLSIALAARNGLPPNAFLPPK